MADFRDFFSPSSSRLSILEGTAVDLPAVITCLTLVDFSLDLGYLCYIKQL